MLDELNVGPIYEEPLSKWFSDGKKIEELVGKLFEEKHIENIEMQSLMSDGKERSVLISGNVMEYGERQVAVLNVRDITLQKASEREIAELNISAAQRVCVRTPDMIEKMMIYTRTGFITLNLERIDFRQMVENMQNNC